MSVFCQFCGAGNPLGREHCSKCGNLLAIVSGTIEDGESPDEEFFQAQEDLEEHLIERITSLEESVRQLSTALAATAEHIVQIEHNLTVAHAGVQTIGGLLENQGVLSRTEVIEGWERTVGRELLSRDLARKFAECAQRILSHARHSGHASVEFEQHLRAVELALVGPDYEMARTLLAKMARLAPRNDELWSFIGEASFELGDLVPARVAFSRVLELRGPHYESLIFLGTVLSDLGELSDAELMLKQAQMMQPDAFLPRFTLGALAMIREDFKEAIIYFDMAAESHEAPQCLYLIGTCHLQLGHPGKAIKSLKTSIELRPDFAEAFYQLGVASLHRGWRRRAVEAFSHAVGLNPQSLQFGETLRLLQSDSSALPLGSEALGLTQHAERALDEGRTDAAFDFFNAAVRHEPAREQLNATVALLACALGRTRQAVHFARHLLHVDSGSPYRPAGIVALLEALRQRGKLRAALRVAQDLYGGAHDRFSRALAAYELALIRSELGEDLEQAREVAFESLEAMPRELRHFPLSALGVVAIKLGRYREALRYLDQAADAGPTPFVIRQLAIARLGIGDHEGAEEVMKRAEETYGAGLEEEMLNHIRRLASVLEGIPKRAPSS